MITSSLSDDGKTITLDLNGSESYTIDLNGSETKITEDKIVLSLKNGINKLKVNTSLSCQGVYEENFIVVDKPFLYPNPAEEFTKIFIGVENINSVVYIYSISGKLVDVINYSNSELLELELDVRNLPAGLYIVKVKGENLKETFKLIKI